MKSDEKKHPNYWWDFLRKENKSKREVEHACKVAAGWVTHSSPELEYIKIQRNKFTGMPLDNEMRDLSAFFSCHVFDEDWASAIDVLKKIELRCAVLMLQEKERKHTKRKETQQTLDI